MKGAFFLGLCFLALVCSTSQAKLRGRGFDKQQLQHFEFQPEELARLQWSQSGSGFVRKLVADNSPIFRSSDWSHEKWMSLKETLRKSMTRAQKLGALQGTRTITASSAPSSAPSSAFIVAFVLEYLLALEVGTPPQLTALTMDTGSELSWVECTPCDTCLLNETTFDPTKSTSYSVVSCSDPVCATASSTGAIQTTCNPTGQNCTFRIEYLGNISAVGNVATDVVVTYPVSDGVSKGASDNKFVFGCGEYTLPGADILLGPGVLGLDRGPLSFASQLQAKKFSYCLPDRSTSDQGYIYFGDLPGNVNASSSTGLKWKQTPMLTNNGPLALRGPYYIGVTGVSVGGTLVDIPQSAWAFDKVTGFGGVVMDSGTTFTVLMPDVYAPLRTALEKQTVGLERNTSAEVSGTAAGVQIGPCYNVPDASKLSSAVPKLTVHLQGGADWELPLDNYFFPFGPPLYCYVFTSTQGLSVSILGNVLQQNFVIEYDLGGEMFSISDVTDCSLQSG